MSKVTNILLVGVGGQGIILASKILSAGLIDVGYDVKMSEVHGMAQRGGSVTTQVRYGDEVYSPIIGKGQADIIVAFEKMEAMRWIEYVRLDGKLVINDYSIPSVPILTGEADYPEGIIEELKDRIDTTVINAVNVAREIGNVKTQNIVMLGALVEAINLDEVKWEDVIRDQVKDKFVDINLKAFDKGRELLK
ncbi:indolepyruvate oxidoreductase subunit beta [Clostridiisalibacter paucivorans]|uniref:indolepyruvate oxidoreductase subunit beta n=1 Tax=Clostridiisalibacter paucivorans TaxID=408753 RepID=UPI00047BB8C6|nr:indolepyruvate oxidoreductase subunit beta [Clostridiisalibacter paucivorans]